jgi:small-conductance mechanosensitive channel
MRENMFLSREILRIGHYGITVLHLTLIVIIAAADLAILRSVNRCLKKRKMLGSGTVRTATLVGKVLLHVGALVGAVRVLGVKMENVFGFLRTVLGFKLFTLSGTNVSLLTFIILVFVVWASAKLARIVRNYFERTLFPRFKLEAGLRFSLSKLIGYLIVALGVVIALQSLGIKLSALAVFAGFLGVGVGFGMQSVVGNIISGFVILFERPIKEGDMVRLPNAIGVVHKINLRASIIRTIYNEHLIVPNSEFINHIVENMSHEDLRLRVSVKVGVAYGTDPHLVKEALIEAARGVADVMENPAPSVLFTDFGESSLDFELLAWIENPTQRFNTESELRFAIVEAFAKQGIAIPFPQRDVWIKTMPS